MPPTRVWPVDPAPFWGCDVDAPPYRRPVPPDLRDHAVFTAALGASWGHLLVGAMWSFVAANIGVFAVAGFYGLLDVWWFKGLAAIAAVGVATGAIVHIVRGHRSRPAATRAAYDDVMASGIIVTGHATRFRIVESGGDGDSENPLGLYIDVTVSDAWAGRLVAAVDAWTDRMRDLDRDTRRELGSYLRKRAPIPTTEVFGPEAVGGYLTVDFINPFRPWSALVATEDLRHSEPDGRGSANVWELSRPKPEKVERARRRLARR